MSDRGTGTTLSSRPPREHVVGRYLGLTLVITEREVDVFRPDGRHVGTAYSISGARRIARGYRGSKR